MQEFSTTKLMTRETYTLAFIEGSLDANPITFKVAAVSSHACVIRRQFRRGGGGWVGWGVLL